MSQNHHVIHDSVQYSSPIQRSNKESLSPVFFSSESNGNGAAMIRQLGQILHNPVRLTSSTSTEKAFPYFTYSSRPHQHRVRRLPLRKNPGRVPISIPNLRRLTSRVVELTRRKQLRQVWSPILLVGFRVLKLC